jgi:hypothetical protein
MVSNSSRRNVTFWAWAVSIVVHLIVLTVFGLFKLSPSKAQGEQSAAPTAGVSQVKKLIQAAPIVPKPKIKTPVRSRPDGLVAEWLGGPASPHFAVSPAKPGLKDLPKPAKPAGSVSGFLSAGAAILPTGIEFFGSRTDQRKVCYLVDCSGSMQGIFGQVRKELVGSIQKLQPDQYFYIIFFGGDRLLEFGGGRLVRATPQAKSTACDFIHSVQPAGQTNALAAIERTVQIRDDSGISPAVVYFLTDGFELTGENTHRFGQKIANLLKRFAPMTRINTIGFWPTAQDCQLLETIAKQSGGEFVLVTDSNN